VNDIHYRARPVASCRIFMRFSPQDRQRLDQLVGALDMDTATAVVRRLVREAHRRLRLPEPQEAAEGNKQ
jgi:hypothetical protein